MIDKDCWYRTQQTLRWSEWRRGTVRMVLWGTYKMVGALTPAAVALVEDMDTKLMIEVPVHYGICFQEEVPDARVNTDDDRARKEKEAAL